MKAPNKVYVNVSDNRVLDASACRRLNSDVEYINKDAIIKYLEHMQEMYVGYAFQMVKDKINSM